MLFFVCSLWRPLLYLPEHPTIKPLTEPLKKKSQKTISNLQVLKVQIKCLLSEFKIKNGLLERCMQNFFYISFVFSISHFSLSFSFFLSLSVCLSLSLSISLNVLSSFWLSLSLSLSVSISTKNYKYSIYDIYNINIYITLLFSFF